MGSLVRITERNPIRRIVKKHCLWQPNEDGDNGLMVDLDEPQNRVRQEWLHSTLKEVPDNSFLKAHLPYSEEMESFLLSLGFKILFIVRDPRDVAVSHCNHIMKDIRHPLYHYFSELPDYSARIRALLNGHVSSQSHVLSPLQQRLYHALGWWRSERTLSVRFEDLIGPKGGGSEAIQKQIVLSICEHLEVPSATINLDHLLKNIFYRNARTFHKGAIGTWRDIFDQETLCFFEKKLAESSEQYGYAM